MVDAPYAGGAERYVSLLAESLDRRRFLPSVVARSGAGLDRWSEHLRERGVPVSRVPMNLPYRPLDLIPIVGALRHHRPHLVHVNMPGPYDGQMGLLAPIARLAGARAVVTTEHLPMVARLWKRALVKGAAYRWADRVFTICNDNVMYLMEVQRVPHAKIEVIYNGLPEEFGRDHDTLRPSARQQLGIEDGCTAIGLVGSLIERKGVATLLDAVSGLDGSSWKVLLVGDGEQRQRLEGRARALGIEERVCFLGQQRVSEVEKVLAALDVLAVPSFMEGMPYVILEAMACSLPVVASRINGIPEAVVDGDTALLFRAGDAGALRRALEQLIGDPVNGRRMGQRGRDRFEKLFTSGRQVTSVQRSYLALLGAPANGDAL